MYIRELFENNRHVNEPRLQRVRPPGSAREGDKGRQLTAWHRQSSRRPRSCSRSGSTPIRTARPLLLEVGHQESKNCSGYGLTFSGNKYERNVPAPILDRKYSSISRLRILLKLMQRRSGTRTASPSGTIPRCCKRCAEMAAVGCMYRTISSWAGAASTNGIIANSNHLQLTAKQLYCRIIGWNSLCNCVQRSSQTECKCSKGRRSVHGCLERASERSL